MDERKTDERPGATGARALAFLASGAGPVPSVPCVGSSVPGRCSNFSRCGVPFPYNLKGIRGCSGAVFQFFPVRCSSGVPKKRADWNTLNFLCFYIVIFVGGVPGVPAVLENIYILYIFLKMLEHLEHRLQKSQYENT